MFYGYNVEMCCSASVLSGHRVAADTIAALIHSDVSITEPKVDGANLPSVNLDDIGVWIDPLGR